MVAFVHRSKWRAAIIPPREIALVAIDTEGVRE